MSKPIVLAHNAIVAKITGADQNAKGIVSGLLSYLVDGHEHMERFKSTGWDGRSSFFSMRDGTFPAGFVHLVYTKLIQAGYKVHLVRRKLPEPLGPENPIVDAFGNDDPRYDYQMRALRAIERHGRGIIQIATGGGKSKVAKLIAARYRRMTMFITTRGVLMYQMKKGFEEAAMKVGVIGDGIWSPVRGVNVGMVQTLVAQLKEPDLDEEARAVIQSAVRSGKRITPAEVEKEAKARFEQKTKVRARTIKLLELVEVVIGEEAHEAGGNSYFEILRHCRNAQIRVALTATPFMRENAEDNMRLQAAFGPVLIRVSEKLLIERGILARPYFKFVVSKPHEKLRKSSPWQRAYQLGYMENPHMIGDIVADARRAADLGMPVLTLIQRKAHGAALKKAMIAAGLRVDFIQGENDQEGRATALDLLSRGRIDALIGTNILDVGVDVPAVALVQLAGGGKAEVATRQRIGRGLRAKKKGPNVTFITDYTTEPNSTLRDHAKQRRYIVESTPGFQEGIVKELPWEIFEQFRKAA